ncbi:MAG TPA: hypothetical protein VIT88_04055 [Pyrinomonadaceae bacterium]
MEPYSTEEQIREVVDGFEKCTTPKEAFTHRDHLTVATWYLCHEDPTVALDQMREGLLRFLDHHGVGRVKYKEHLTVSWMTLVERSIEKMDAKLSIIERTNKVIHELGDSRLVADARSE